MNTMPQPDAPVEQKNWFSRNWKWLVPVGCLVPLLCCVSFGAATYFGVSKIIGGSPAFVTALERASQNPEAKQALGEPMTPGFGIQGSINEKNGRATADFTAPIEGPKGKGTLRVVGSAVNDVWSYERMELETNGKIIDLMPQEPTPEAEPMPEPADPADEPEGE